MNKRKNRYEDEYELYKYISKIHKEFNALQKTHIQNFLDDGDENKYLSALYSDAPKDENVHLGRNQDGTDKLGVLYNPLTINVYSTKEYMFKLSKIDDFDEFMGTMRVLILNKEIKLTDDLNEPLSYDNFVKVITADSIPEAKLPKQEYIYKE